MSYKYVIATALLCVAAFAQTPLSVKHFVAPDYPVAAWLSRIEGTTVADIAVKADGTVDSAKVVSAHPLFRHAVESALKQWTFSTAMATSLRVTTRFQLDDGCPLSGSPEGDKRYYVSTQVVADLPATVEVKTCLPVITIETSKSGHQ
ncbi:MAG TPA: energy transducer TonB [Terriglobales bacterium]|nr:energy transducer TonB [Terriglobales bacterium]